MLQTSDPAVWYVTGAVAILAIIILAVVLSERNRSRHLREKFGPEYTRTVSEMSDRKRAETELSKREKRVQRMHIEEIPAGAKMRYTEEWLAVQKRFVDEPKSALVTADQLVANVMRDRGYPTSDFDQTVEDLSPDHPHVLENFRAAHSIVDRTKNGAASTEEMRQAMVYYRSLFDDLLGRNKE